MELRKQHIVLILVGALILGFLGAYIGVQMGDNKQESSEHVEKQEDNEQEGSKQVEQQEDNESSFPDVFDKNVNSDLIPADQMQKFEMAFEIIDENYLEKVDADVLIEGAIEGMLEKLDDPFSSYMDIEMMSQFNEQIEASFEGIGAEVTLEDDIVTIVSPIKGSPAEENGLRPQDQILKIDDESIEGFGLQEAVDLIRGEKGTDVVLQIQRPGTSEPFDVTITRDTIPLETVEATMEEYNGHKTGVVKVTSFAETTADDFITEVEKLEDQGMEGLVIDVRGNPGGLLDQVEKMLQQFVPSDMPYLQIEDQQGNKDPFYSDLKEKKPYPITVIIDEGSASASEILAVALQEVGYEIVGLPSFGKGTVQQVADLNDGTNIKLTMFKWLSPEGNWINDVGVEPSVEVELPAYYYTSPIQAEEPLTPGEKGEKVTNAQEMLRGLGYTIKDNDGEYGKDTEKAVQEFQKENDLKETGEINEDTAGVIQSKIIEQIREEKDDNQLEKAKETLYSK
ncbi:MAG TPA: S41 family peptidase [Bacillota bacterium]|nr:S41 family peptidase [Bacillota bacterium]